MGKTSKATYGTYGATEAAAVTDSQLAQGLKRVDMNELATEEAIQHEKARTAREIEQEAGELHGAYKEFNALVQEQQKGLDTMQHNVETAVVKVVRGKEELETASTHQKSARKRMCCLIGILAVVIIVVIVVVVVVLKK